MSRFIRHIGFGFTLIELMVVIAVMAIAALMVIPMLGSAGPTKVQSAVQALAADMEYARNMAVTYGRTYGVRFSITGSDQYYQVVDNLGQVINHPVTKSPYTVRFTGTSLDGVDIAEVDLDGAAEVRFNHLGSPFNGTGQPLNKGLIRLQMGGFSQAVIIEPVTGYIRIQ